MDNFNWITIVLYLGNAIEADQHPFMKKHLLVFSVIFILGSLLGTLGTISFPIGVNITYFWPAAALQTVSGIFFGFWGILGGVAFPIISNALTDSSWAHTIGFIPANIIQCTLPFVMIRGLHISLQLKRTKDISFFILGCTVLPHVLGSLVGCGILYGSGYINNSTEFWNLVWVWIVGNVPSSIIFGFLLVKNLTPILTDCGLFYKGFFK